MRVLLTGCDGYLGPALAHRLLGANHSVTGLDAGYHRSGWLFPYTGTAPRTLTRDVRDLEVRDLEGFDAVVHLAEISNDPVGSLNDEMTLDINHRGSVGLAERAKRAGVKRFVHMSSCSVYGATSDRASSETDATDPLTVYARCKVQVERDVTTLADSGFSPTFMRNATAYGASPRQRFDLVVNDLAASAFVFKEIRVASDGTPWRPFIHLQDIAGAVACVLDAPTDSIHTEIFNTGSDDQNHQVRDIAEIVAQQVPGCALTFGPPSDDRRDYRVDFRKIHEQLPGFACEWTIERGVREMLTIFRAIGLDEAQYRWRGHTRLAQIRHLLDTRQTDDRLHWIAS